MKRFVIEREVSGIGGKSAAELKAIAGISNGALAELAPHVQWEHSYVTGDKTFCVYLADDEAAVRKHAELSGIPANTITPVIGIIDPLTAE